MKVDVRAERTDAGWVVTVAVAGRQTTEHHVTVHDEDLERYGATDSADLVRRSFDFLLAREPNTSILREFRITEIERYFPDFAASIRGTRALSDTTASEGNP